MRPQVAAKRARWSKELRDVESSVNNSAVGFRWFESLWSITHVHWCEPTVYKH